MQRKAVITTKPMPAICWQPMLPNHYTCDLCDSLGNRWERDHLGLGQYAPVGHPKGYTPWVDDGGVQVLHGSAGCGQRQVHVSSFEATQQATTCMWYNQWQVHVSSPASAGAKTMHSDTMRGGGGGGSPPPGGGCMMNVASPTECAQHEEALRHSLSHEVELYRHNGYR
jgi:hypothetical protein